MKGDLEKSAQQEDLKSYFTAVDKMLFGLKKEKFLKLFFDIAEEYGIYHSCNNDTKMAGENWLANFKMKHKFSVRKPEVILIARAMGSIQPNETGFATF